MRAIRLVLLALSYALTLAASGAAAQTADEIRGGWTAEIDGRLQVYLFKIRGTAITGVYCQADCRNPDNLALIESGRLTGDGLEATLWVDVPGSPVHREHLVGRWSNGQLSATRQSADGSGPVREFVLVKSPAPPALAAPAGPPTGGPAAAGQVRTGNGAAVPPARARPVPLRT